MPLMVPSPLRVRCFPCTDNGAVARMAWRGPGVILLDNLAAGKADMLCEEGLCAPSSVQAGLRAPGKLYLTYLLSPLAVAVGASPTLDIPAVFFPPLPFSIPTKHLTPSEVDLHRCAGTPTSSHVYPTPWNQPGPPKLPHSHPTSSCLCPPLPPAPVPLPGASAPLAGACTSERVFHEITEHPGRSQPISSPPAGTLHSLYTSQAAAALPLWAPGVFPFPLVFMGCHIHQHETLMSQRRGDFRKSLFIRAQLLRQICYFCGLFGPTPSSHFALPLTVSSLSITDFSAPHFLELSLLC